MNKKKKIIIIAVAAVLAIAAVIAAVCLPKKDKAATGEVSISVEKDDFYLSDNVIETLSVHPDRYMDTVADAYGMGNAKAKEFFAAPENWLAFDITMQIENTGTENVVIRGFDITGNGKNGMYVSKIVGGELSLSPGAKYPVSASILCDNGDLTLDEARAMAEELKLSVLYSKAPEQFDDGTESEEKVLSVVIQ